MKYSQQDALVLTTSLRTETDKVRRGCRDSFQLSFNVNFVQCMATVTKLHCC